MEANNWKDYYPDCPLCGSNTEYRESNFNMDRQGNVLKAEAVYHCSKCGSFIIIPDAKEAKTRMDNQDIENRFTYHAPKPGQPEIYTAIRDKAKEFAVLIDINCPDSREKSLAMTKLEEAVMWANASVARNG